MLLKEARAEEGEGEGEDASLGGRRQKKRNTHE